MAQYGQRKYGTFRYGTDIPSTGQPQTLTDAPLWRKPGRSLTAPALARRHAAIESTKKKDE